MEMGGTPLGKKKKNPQKFDSKLSVIALSLKGIVVHHKINCNFLNNTSFVAFTVHIAYNYKLYFFI